jgi:hypothetical protein
MKKAVYLLFITIIICGCATVSSIDNKYAKINYQDGISKREAITIAQKELIESERLKEGYDISRVRVEQNRGSESRLESWTIKFPNNRFGASLWGIYYLVTVDSNTGVIISGGIRN